MKISELIKILTQIKNIIGDISVVDSKGNEIHTFNEIPTMKLGEVRRLEIC